MALSTTHAEYIAACQTTREIMWLKTLLKELCGEHKLQVTLYVDNQSAIQIIKNPVLHKRTKHIDIKFHYVRDRYLEGSFDLKYVNTKEQLGDILTKPLPRPQFNQLRSIICQEF